MTGQWWQSLLPAIAPNLNLLFLERKLNPHYSRDSICLLLYLPIKLNISHTGASSKTLHIMTSHTGEGGGGNHPRLPSL